LLLVKAFCTHVRRLLEYCCAVWSPHNHYLTDKIEGVQHFFTKRLAGHTNESYYVRLLLLKLESLEYRRLTQDLVLCDKIHLRLVDTEVYNALPRPVRTITRGQSFRLHKVSCSIDATKCVFTCRIHYVWNELPDSAVNSESVAVFEKRLRSVDLSAHLCYRCFISV
jgi:hypothetical protein